MFCFFQKLINNMNHLEIELRNFVFMNFEFFALNILFLRNQMIYIDNFDQFDFSIYFIVF